MVSFQKLLDLMESDLEDEVQKNKSFNVIRKGLEIRDPGCGDFWEDFMAVCADATAVAELLDVPVTKVSKWASIIQEGVKQVEELGSNNKPKSKVIDTGNEPIADPNGAETPFDGPADTRPMP
jgi:hypothetical protein